MRTRTLTPEVPGLTPWHEPSQSPPLAPPKSGVGSSVGSPQAKQPTGREPSPPSADKQIKVLLSSAHQSNTQLYPPQSLPSGNLHKPLREPHPPEGRQQKQEELQSCSLGNKNHIHRKIDKMKRQRAMYQRKEQDKTLEKQLNEVEIGNLP